MKEKLFKECYDSVVARGKTIKKLEKRISKLRRKSASQHRYLSKPRVKVTIANAEEENVVLQMQIAQLENANKVLKKQVEELKSHRMSKMDLYLIRFCMISLVAVAVYICCR
jgi:flagellar biosynthesis chaperone FliJ